MRRLVSLSTLSCVVMLFSGCPEHEAQALFAQASLRYSESCEAEPLAGSSVPQYPFGVLDLSISRVGYFNFIQLVNLMASSEEVSGLGAPNAALENNVMQVLGATISYDTKGLAVSLPSGFFQYSPTGVLPQEAGLGIVNGVPPFVANILRTDPALSGTKNMRDPLIKECFNHLGKSPTWEGAPLGGRFVDIVARMTFEAYLLDGIEVRSNEFRFPIRVCNGCLVEQVPPDVFLAGLANDTPFESEINPVTCLVGQDRVHTFEQCFAEHYFIEQAHEDELIACAEDAAFPKVGTPTCPNPGVESFLGCYKSGDINHLAVRYGIERVFAYCYTTADSPLWPPQQ